MDILKILEDEFQGVLPHAFDNFEDCTFNTIAKDWSSYAFRQLRSCHCELCI